MTAIYSIGYGGRSIGEFIDLLRENGIELIADVRSVPWSGFNPDFTRAALERILREAGIGYLFIGDSLGGRPDDESCFVDGLLNAESCENHDWYMDGIHHLKSLAKGRRVAMMCSEKDPANCHRGYTLGKTLRKDSSIAVRHIDKDGSIKDQQALEDAIPPVQRGFL